MSRLRRPFLYDRYILLTVAYLAVIVAPPQPARAWGGEGHQIIAILAEHYMRPQTAARMRQLLAPREPRRGLVVSEKCVDGRQRMPPFNDSMNQ